MRGSPHQALIATLRSRWCGAPGADRSGDGSRIALRSHGGEVVFDRGLTGEQRLAVACGVEETTARQLIRGSLQTRCR